MQEICNAICTALQDDAGGFGTAGFHLVSFCSLLPDLICLLSVYFCIVHALIGISQHSMKWYGIRGAKNHIRTHTYCCFDKQTRNNEQIITLIQIQEKVKNLQMSSANEEENFVAMFTATLHPVDSNPLPTTTTSEQDDLRNHYKPSSSSSWVELTPQKLITNHNSQNISQHLLGNDVYYASLYSQNDDGCNNNHNNNGGGGDISSSNIIEYDGKGRFKLRIVVTKANEDILAKTYYDGLFDLMKELNDSNNNKKHDDDERCSFGIIITEEMVNENENLKLLKQQVLDARLANEVNNQDTNNNNNSGYNVTIMLCEPHVTNDDIVIPPPSYWDKLDANFNAVPYPKNHTGSDDVNFFYCHGGGNDFGGGFGGKNNICSPLKFISPGPWEKANLQAFELIALDVKKALVRVEFPMVTECRKKTFREVYQLNAKVSYSMCGWRES